MPSAVIALAEPELHLKVLKGTGNISEDVKGNKAGVRKSHTGGRAVQAAGTICAKDLGQDRAWFFRGAGRRPAWLEQSERGEEGEWGAGG